MTTWSDFALPAATCITLAVQGVGVSRIYMDKVIPPPIEGHGAVSGPVHPGGNVIVDWVIAKRTDCPGENGRVWNGEDGFHLSESLRPTGLPMSDAARHYQIETKIPDLAPVGKLELRIDGKYKCPGAPPVPFSLGPVVMEVVR